MGSFWPWRQGRIRVTSKVTMIVGVHPLAGFDRLLHYSVPESLRSSATVGSLVRVPIPREAPFGHCGFDRAAEGFSRPSA